VCLCLCESVCMCACVSARLCFALALPVVSVVETQAWKVPCLPCLSFAAATTAIGSSPLLAQQRQR
jgi:hypothetical protein